MEKFVAQRLVLNDFRNFQNKEVFIGKRLTAIAGINGTGKSTILGLLANSGEMKKHRRYDGRRFRSEFSELFKATLEHDPRGSNRVVLCMATDKGDLNVVFRTTWQDSDTRFRVIPKWNNGEKNTESKVPIPTVYLGLSRLYPVGEAPDEDVEAKGITWSDPADKEWFIEEYQHMLSLRDAVTDVESVRIESVKAKQGVGIDTDRYSAYSNSAGQDNLGQILLAALSFRKLHRELGGELPGGMLLIDELDSALHPAAQIRLVDLLDKESKRLGYQVIFTTHSTVILNYLQSKTRYNPDDASGDIEIVYLTDAQRSLVVKRNPSWADMESDLYIGTAKASRTIGVITEDAEARWMAKALTKELAPKVYSYVNFIEASLGCGQIKQLYDCDYAYMVEHIIVFDGDVVASDEGEVFKKLLEKERAVLKLPGSKRPEEIVFDYLKNSPEDSTVWRDLDRMGFNYRMLEDNGPLSSAYASYTDERNKYKAWFKENKHYFNGANVMAYWAKDNENTAKEFAEGFTSAWEFVAKRKL